MVDAPPEQGEVFSAIADDYDRLIVPGTPISYLLIRLVQLIILDRVDSLAASFVLCLFPYWLHF
jgi:hypothetical protein